MYDDASLLGQRSLSTRLLETSIDSGWSSTLVERRRPGTPQWSVDSHPTSDLHLVVVLRGHYVREVLHDGRWSGSSLDPGAVRLVPGGQGLQLRGSSSSGCDVGHLFLPQRLIRDAAQELHRADARTPERSISSLRFDDPVVATTVVALLAAARSGAPDLYAQQAVHWLAVHLLAVHGGADGNRTGARRPSRVDDRVSRSVELLRARFAEPLSLDVLASEAAVSKFHFARMFREKTGRSPHAFLVETRMAEARRLLAETDLSVAEVARRSGHGSPAQFGAAFKRRHGMTPTAFRGRRDAAEAAGQIRDQQPGSRR